MPRHEILINDFADRFLSILGLEIRLLFNGERLLRLVRLKEIGRYFAMVSLVNGLGAQWNIFFVILRTLRLALYQSLAHGGRAYLINLSLLELQIWVQIRLGLVLDETHVRRIHILRRRLIQQRTQIIGTGTILNEAARRVAFQHERSKLIRISILVDFLLRELATLHIHQSMFDGLRGEDVLLSKLDCSAARFQLLRFFKISNFSFYRFNVHHLKIVEELFFQLFVIFFVNRFIFVVELLNDQERQVAEVGRRDEARMIQGRRRR
jgi:hypothetical protein